MSAKADLSPFFSRLASAEPTPGGGAVAALNLSQGAALLAMAMAVSKVESPDLQGHAQTAWQRGLELAEADSAAFSAVMKAYRLPKSNEQEQTARRALIQQALTTAGTVPLQVAQTAAGLAEHLETIASQVTDHVVSDVAVACDQLVAAINSASWMVKVNAHSLKADDPARLDLLKQLTAAEDARTTIEKTRDQLRSRV